jgi:hypothetical protein
MGSSIKDKKANELSCSYRNYYDKMVGRGFTPAQIAITSIVISISQYNLTKGVGAGIAVICSCLNSFMGERDFEITEISGYYQKKDEEITKEKNIIHVDFTNDD